MALCLIPHEKKETAIYNRVWRRQVCLKEKDVLESKVDGSDLRAEQFVIELAAWLIKEVDNKLALQTIDCF